MDHQQRLIDIIAILTKKLGGNIVISQRELQHPPTGTVTRNADSSMTIVTD